MSGFPIEIAMSMASHELRVLPCGTTVAPKTPVIRNRQGSFDRTFWLFSRAPSEATHYVPRSQRLDPDISELHTRSEMVIL